MKDRFLENIQKNNLFCHDDKLILAISGGADSVALSILLSDCGFNFINAHCNFNLRGEESLKDEKFVQDLSRSLNVKCKIKSFDAQLMSRKKKISLQMAARELRYSWFEDLRKELDAKYILVAHTQNDIQETFFINLLRGSGIRGFLGIKSINEKIIRPLLPFKRSEIEEYLILKNESYCSDSSNNDIKYLRNNIRKNLLPFFYKMNPSFDQTLSNDMRYLNSVFCVYLAEIDKMKDQIVTISDSGIIINKELLINYDHCDALLYEILRPFGFPEIHSIISSCRFRNSGKLFYSDRYKLLIDRSTIIVELIEEYNQDVYIKIDKDQEEIKNPIQLRFKISSSDEIIKENRFAYLDLDKLTFPLILRRWKNGDAFYPLGMTGKKKLSDFFIDNKLSLFQKEDMFVVTSGNDIAWVVGHRISEKFKISETTKKSYIAELL